MVWNREIFRVILLLNLWVIATSIFGCGYHFQGSASVLPPDVKTIAIPLPSNSTTFSGLGQMLAEKLRSRFERYGVVKVIDLDQGPDAILNARIADVKLTVKDVTGKDDIVLEQNINMTVEASLKRPNGQPLWQGTVVATESTAATNNVIVTSSSSFVQSGIDSVALGSLSEREVARGSQTEAYEDLTDEASRIIYVDAVAADF